jgi:hypothetical protein
MTLTRIAVVCAAPIALGLLSAPALAAPTAFEKAVLAELDAPTRAGIEKRATDGNTVLGVVGTTLLNNYYGAGARTPGDAVTVVAIDFARGVVVFQRSANVFELQKFNTKTLQMIR